MCTKLSELDPSRGLYRYTWYWKERVGSTAQGKRWSTFFRIEKVENLPSRKRSLVKKELIHFNVFWAIESSLSNQILAHFVCVTHTQYFYLTTVQFRQLATKSINVVYRLLDNETITLSRQEEARARDSEGTLLVNLVIICEINVNYG